MLELSHPPNTVDNSLQSYWYRIVSKW